MYNTAYYNECALHNKVKSAAARMRRRRGWLKIKRLYLLVVDRQDYEYNNISIVRVCVCQSVGPLSVADVSVQKVIGKWIYYVVVGRSRVMGGICICFLRKSKGPSSSEKGNRTTPFDVHPHIHNKICNILLYLPLVIIIMQYVLYVPRNSRPSRGRRRSLFCLKPIWPYYCVYVFGYNITAY